MQVVVSPRQEVTPDSTGIIKLHVNENFLFFHITFSLGYQPWADDTEVYNSSIILGWRVYNIADQWNLHIHHFRMYVQRSNKR